MLPVAAGVLAAVCLIVASATAARAAESRSVWLREHTIAELAGVGGWRTSLGLGTQAQGFEALTGGVDLVLGLALSPAWGLLATGRFITGPSDVGLYREVLGGVGVELHMSRAIRLRAGAAVGTAAMRRDQAALVGGFVMASIDLVPIGRAHFAAVLQLRFDYDAAVSPGSSLPEQSIALVGGLGFRY